MIDFLNQPYPTPDPSWRHVWKSVLAGLFIGGSLIIFQPFGIDGLEIEGKTQFLAGFGLITFFWVFIFQHILPRVFERFFQESTWKNYKEVSAMFMLLICIGLSNGFYDSWYLPIRGTRLEHALGLMINTFTLGAFPAAFFVLFDSKRLSKIHENESAEIRKELAQGRRTQAVVPAYTQETKKTISLSGENEGEHLECKTSALLYLESQSNYVKICFQQSGKIENILFRSSLTRLAEQLQSEPALLKCHRSYVVNIDQVRNVEGNAQGLRLSLEGLENEIPVSRKYVPQVRSHFK